MRLIDADNLNNLLKEASNGYERDGDLDACVTISEVLGIIHLDCQTVDAVEVVRCKDCRWGREVCGNIECSVDLNLPPEYHGYEWFCPNGEKREE